MPKRELKTRILKKQHHKDAITKKSLKGRKLLNTDIHRLPPKRHHGVYEQAATMVTDPVVHMQEHGTLRVREVTLEDLKALCDDRRQILKIRNKIQNQLGAFERRTDWCRPEIDLFLRHQLEAPEVELAKRTKMVELAIQEYAARDPLVFSALRVPRVGPLTVAMLTAYVRLDPPAEGEIPPPRLKRKKLTPEEEEEELAKRPPYASTPSALWRYCGLDKPGHERYTKGKTSGGNKWLRIALWNMTDGMIKDVKCTYRPIYDEVKHRLEHSDRLVWSRNTGGHLVHVAWKDTKPCHRHGAAQRAMMKRFLFDYWFVGREILDLPTRQPYCEEYLDHGHITSPATRGWQWVRGSGKKK